MKCQCDNCDWTGTRGDIAVPLELLYDLGERLSPGGTVPVGDCPKCGAFAYFAPDARDRLNAAAPDLLAALRIIGDVLPDEGGGTFHIGAQSCDIIRAALGKVMP